MDWSALMGSRVKRTKADVGIVLEGALGYPREYISVQISTCASGLFHKAFEVSMTYHCKFETLTHLQNTRVSPSFSRRIRGGNGHQSHSSSVRSSSSHCIAFNRLLLPFESYVMLSLGIDNISLRRPLGRRNSFSLATIVSLRSFGT